jgi:hypothetical protein
MSAKDANHRRHTANTTTLAATRPADAIAIFVGSQLRGL